MRPPRFGIVGYKNAGKTTLVCRLVAEFTARGLRVSTVKHAHSLFDIDREGTDSHAHRCAGAREVALVGARRWALMRELRGEAEPSLDAIADRMGAADLLLVEGFKRDRHPKIEVRADERRLDPAACPNIVARVGAGEALGRDDVGPIADLIARHLALADA